MGLGCAAGGPEPGRSSCGRPCCGQSIGCPGARARLLCSWNSPGKNNGVDYHFFLQGIFLTQGSNPGLLRCRQILYHLSHQGSP